MKIETGTPALFPDESGEPVLLGRVGHTDPRIHEAFIQDLVLRHPQVLPIDDIDPAFAPLLPIGSEVPTSAGPIDALYVSPSGNLTVVEAKLWRNPEARRQVVGQIIDYATVLAGWSYEQLDAQCRARTETGLWDLVQARVAGAPAHDESVWVDRVSRGLRAGRFLLLVVGDGIRSEVERMAAYVRSSPHLEFSLALVELRVYEDPVRGVRLVVPSVVARTDEVVRAVVQVAVSDGEVDVEVTVPTDSTAARRGTLAMSEFFELLATNSSPDQADFVGGIFDEFRQDPRFRLTRRKASVSLRLEHPTESAQFTVLVFSSEGSVGPGWLHDQCEKWGVPVDVAERFVSGLSSTLGIPRHPRFASNLARGATIAETAEAWPSISRLIDELGASVTEALDDSTGQQSGG